MTRNSVQKTATSKERPRRLAIPVWLRLLRIVHSGDARLRAHLRRYGLNIPQFDVIAQVGRREGLTQRELADRLVVTPGNVTQLLDKMEAAGLVVRMSQGRCNRIQLTERGRALFDEVVPRQEELIAEHFSPLSAEELRSLAAIARKLLHRDGNS